MQNKKGFTLIELMIVVAIIAILAMIAVPMFQRYIERSRNSAAQNLLHQLATAMTAYNVDNSVYLPAGTITTQQAMAEALMVFGFRPDPNVGFQIVAPGATVTEPGFVAYAAHKAKGSRLYVYDNINGSGVMAMASNTTTDPVGGAGGVGITPAGAFTGPLNVWSIDTGNAGQLIAGNPATVTVTNGKTE